MSTTSKGSSKAPKTTSKSDSSTTTHGPSGGEFITYASAASSPPLYSLTSFPSVLPSIGTLLGDNYHNDNNKISRKKLQHDFLTAMALPLSPEYIKELHAMGAI
jgi:hypothetical protein